MPYDGYRWHRVKNTYLFLCQAELEHRPFSLQELQEASGYSPQTVDSYRTKRWEPFLRRLPTGHFTCQDVLNCSWELFAQRHKEKRGPMPDQPPQITTNEMPEKPQIGGGHLLRLLIRRGWAYLQALIKP